MSLLVRKIAQAKWRKSEKGTIDELSADAITGCLRTSQNTLSVWRIQDEKKIDEAVLAIASGHKRLETFDVVWLLPEQLGKEGLEIKDSPGLTPIAAFVNNHSDVVNLTYSGLGKIARCILTCLSQKRFKRYNRAEVKKLLMDAINSGILEVANIEPRLAKDLSLSLELH